MQAQLLRRRSGPATVPPSPAFNQIASSPYQINTLEAFTGAVTAGDLLVAGIFSTAGVTTVADNVNGTWHKIASVATAYSWDMWYFANSGAAGAGALTVTATTTGGGSGTFNILDYSYAGALDTAHGIGYATATGTGTAVSAGPTSALTRANELVVGGGWCGASRTITTSANLRTTSPNTIFCQDALAASASGQSSALTLATSTTWTMIVAVFLWT